ncbi:hypothetical protein [Falsiroseomonas selenitidurans]|uniref:EF-hand domain-containing protein n=1 Tax=Falsiroseomonas selenitidurans TaxID=2716335 RepID=A0ABX1E4A3_9PROT|nr:hypothetical protein [Falsiroseomonas selenitidurans]NKC32012.1 hypothetical protein [Falsiroseomonas selenitidurans]
MSRFRMRIAAALLLAAGTWPALAQSSQPGVPEALRGAWFAGGCADPEAMLAVTARAAARLETGGPSRLFRFRATAEHGAWTLGTAGGAEAPRLLLRAADAGLETAEPDAKLRDDRLPGDSMVTAWQRCPAPPVALAALHGEGVAFLAALEHLEAGCGSGTPGACAAAIVAQADVSGDNALSPAELARLARGAAWVAAVQEGATAEVVGGVAGIGTLGGILSARLLLESLDYDGDGRLSPAELAQDRVGFATAAGTTAGSPLRMDGVSEGAAALRALMEGLATLR